MHMCPHVYRAQSVDRSIHTTHSWTTSPPGSCDPLDSVAPVCGAGTVVVLRGGTGRRLGLTGCSTGFGDENAFPGIGISGGGSEEGASDTFITRSSGEGGAVVPDLGVVVPDFGAMFEDNGAAFEDNGATIGGLILGTTDVDRFCDSFGGRAGASAYECRLEASEQSTAVRAGRGVSARERVEKASASRLGLSNEGTERVLGWAGAGEEEKLGLREDEEIGGGWRVVNEAPDERGVTIGVTTPVGCRRRRRKDVDFFVLHQIHQISDKL